VTQRSAFLSKLEEEEKKSEEEEEEEKRSDDEDDDYDDEEASADVQMMLSGVKSESDCKIDQILYFMSQSLIFGKLKDWKKIKNNFITISLCTVASVKPDSDKQEEEKEAFRLRVS
jgi:hypothetical protein